MNSCEVLIVGGGPAGSTCAWQLHRAGLDVLVMDKRSFPRDKVCAGWITPRVTELLELDFDDYRQGRTLQPFHGFQTGHMDGPPVTTRYTQAVSYGIRRIEFDHYLLQRSDARLRLGEAVSRIDRQDGRWLINGQISARLLIGAGGHFCPVAHQLHGRENIGESVIAAQELEFALTPAQQARCAVSPEVPELYFCGDLNGYGWCVRKGDYLNIGLGHEGGDGLGRQVKAFHAQLAKQGRIPADLQERFNGHAYLLYKQRSPRPLVAEGALLIGDAAGLAYPQSGEGILPAVTSGLLAAEAVLAADGDYREAALAPYATRLRQSFGPREIRPDLLSWLPVGIKHRVGRRLLASPWFSRRVLLDNWFLHTD